MNTKTRIIALFLTLMLVLSTVAFTGCSKDEAKTTSPEKTEQKATAETKTTVGAQTDEAKITVKVKITHADGSVKDIDISTAADNLMDALDLEGLIVKDGTMITSVDGEAADYSANGSWWCISKAGEMLMTGAADTPIADGETYELTYTIG